MLHFFNRRELVITHRMEELSRIREILSVNEIPYSVKTRNAVSTPFGSRGRAVSYGMKTEFLYEYRVFVKKEDLDKAQYLIRK